MTKREVRYAVRKPDGTIETKAVPEVRHAEVIIKTDGTVTVIARPYGFCFEPGLGIAYSDGVRPVADVQFFFVRRWGVNAGILYENHLRLYLAASYSLSAIRLNNTSLWAGMTLQKDPIFGISLRL